MIITFLSYSFSFHSEQIFSSSGEICLKLREKDVDTIFEVIVECKEASTQAQLMVALQAMAKVLLLVASQ